MHWILASLQVQLRAKRQYDRSLRGPTQANVSIGASAAHRAGTVTTNPEARGGPPIGGGAKQKPETTGESGKTEEGRTPHSEPAKYTMTRKYIVTSEYIVTCELHCDMRNNQAQSGTKRKKPPQREKRICAVALNVTGFQMTENRVRIIRRSDISVIVEGLHTGYVRTVRPVVGRYRMGHSGGESGYLDVAWMQRRLW